MLIPIETAKGSIWRKWDLHIHSIYSREPRAKFKIQEIFDIALNKGISVIAITDHTNVDGLDEIREIQEKEFTKLGITYKYKDFVRFIPGIELKTNRGNKPVHITAFFPDTITIEGCEFPVSKDFLQKELLNKIDCSEVDIKIAGNGIYEKGLFEKSVDFVKAASRIHYLGGVVVIHGGTKENGIETGMSHAHNPDDVEELLNSLGGEKEELVNKYIDICELPNWNKNNQKNKDFYLSKFNKPSIVASDAHDSYEGNRYTWIKADCTFEGLKQIIFEPAHRVHIADFPPVEPLYKISCVSLSFPKESKLEDDAFCLNCVNTLHFSPYYNCIIGGRGTGKSSILNLIHEKLKPGENRFFQEHNLFISENKKISDCVKVDDDDDEKYVEFLSQNEIETFAKNQDKFTQAIYFRLRKLDPQDGLGSLENKLEQHLKEIDKQAKRIEEQTFLNSKISNFKKELQTNKKLVTFFQDKRYLSLRQTLREKSVELESLKKSNARLSELIEKLKNVLKENPIDSIEMKNIYDEQYLIMLKKINEMIEKANSKELFIEIKKQETNLEGVIKNTREHLDMLLREFGVSAENSREIAIANEKIASLETQISSTEQAHARVTEEIAEFSMRPQLVAKYEETIRSLLKPINERLKEIAAKTNEVKEIELKYSFNHEKAIDDIAGEMAIKLSDERNIPRIDFIRNCLTIVSPSKVNRFDDFQKAMADPKGKVHAMISDYLSNPVNFEIYKLLIKRHLYDVAKYKEVMVYYDNKPLINSSFGQRCTAAIVILLLLGNNPIIIDEPEAHLDSSLIAKYLVELIKQQKSQRQVIFATHNANFVVNGDAELIHVLTMEDKTTEIYSTTIENLRYRQQLLLLEGGQKAFEQRERRYVRSKGIYFKA